MAERASIPRIKGSAKAKAPAGTSEQKIGDFYASCMDEAAIDAAGIRALDAEFAAIVKVQDVSSLVERVAK